MTEQDILNSLIAKFPGLINNRYPFPSPFEGKGELKAIVLGADPTHLVNGEAEPFDMVFGLEQKNTALLEINAKEPE